MVVMDLSDTTVIIPTLNERESIAVLIKRLLRLYNGVHIMVTDDGSVDGTANIVAALRRKHNSVVLLDRSRKQIKGLTASVLDAALLVKTPKIVIMDGDLQHPPEVVGRIAMALDKSEIAVAVRSEVRSWSAQRRLVSRTVSAFAYLVFRLRGKSTCNDMMSGFFGVRTIVLRRIYSEHRNHFVLGGYKLLLDIFRVARLGKLSEIRYNTFHEREHGVSKLGFAHAMEALESILR